MVFIHLLEYLGVNIQTTSLEECRLTLSIADIHLQPFGILHGGINGILIETACSLGANENLSEQSYAVGVDLQVNHLRSVSTGTLTVSAKPDHIGKSIQVWQATIYDEQQRLISVGRCTLANRLKAKEQRP